MATLLKRIRYRLLELFAPYIAIEGVKLALDRKALSRKVIQGLVRKNYEQHEARIIRETVSPEDIILELGGGLGFIALLCSRYCPPENIHTIEANPALIDVIKKNFRLNKRISHVENGMVTVGNPEPFLDFFLFEDFYYSSSVRQKGAKTIIQVPNVSLTQKLETIRPSYLIVDIEGGEYDLFQTIQIPDFVRKICIELHPNYVNESYDMGKHLEQQGFHKDPRLSIPNQLFCYR